MMKDEILALIGTCESVPVDIPEWETKAWIKHLSVAERLSISGDDGDGISYSMKLLSICMQNEEGEIIFTADELSDMPGEQTNVLLTLLRRCREINGIDSGGESDDMGKS